ncbi:maleylpyruvate isomerase family mycothiol-dependent enzyme [Phytoactinopolyspora mesophila]|nr:maleylpyruvate isomerase family mycothiol-dependent enzyme [Phytoactinopolyspora mesophila]
MSSKNSESDNVESTGPITAATDRLVATASTFDVEALAAPSLCPGWTRAHVLAHVARNADALTNLLKWARTGVETPMYPNRQTRNSDIEATAKQPADELIEDLQKASDRFASAVTELPAEHWQREVVTGPAASGQAIPARRTLWLRLRELEVHHLDLDAGYTVDNWPDMFVRRALAETIRGFNQREDTPHFTAVIDGATTRIGSSGQVVVSGSARPMLAWLMGRTSGQDLQTQNGPVPDLPAWL